ncbi:hypothetical protein [Cupriavidus sp. L7L]|nr:hypothetical protein [Cupriavidus sp. L7L]
MSKTLIIGPMVAPWTSTVARIRSVPRIAGDASGWCFRFPEQA